MNVAARIIGLVPLKSRYKAFDRGNGFYNLGIDHYKSAQPHQNKKPY